jgi:hypothetical protein
VKASSPSLRVLELRRSEAGIGALQTLISASPQLTTVKYEWWRDLDIGHEISCSFEVQAFMETILSSKRSLQELSLIVSFSCTTFDIGVNPGWYGIEGYLTDLRELENLKQLRMPLRVLLAFGSHGSICTTLLSIVSREVNHYGGRARARHTSISGR